MMNTENQELKRAVKAGQAKSVLAGVVMGGLAGAVTMLLFAPQPGEKTRAEIKDGALKLRDRTTETVNEKLTQVKSRAHQVTEDVKIKIHDLQHQGQDLLTRQLERLPHSTEEGQKALQASQN
jgi:gas vesicle protein